MSKLDRTPSRQCVAPATQRAAYQNAPQALQKHLLSRILLIADLGAVIAPWHVCSRSCARHFKGISSAGHAPCGAEGRKRQLMSCMRMSQNSAPSHPDCRGVAACTTKYSNLDVKTSAHQIIALQTNVECERRYHQGLAAFDVFMVLVCPPHNALLCSAPIHSTHNKSYLPKPP